MYGILANYQTGLGYKFTNGWNAQSDSTVEFMNAPKLSLLKRDHCA